MSPGTIVYSGCEVTFWEDPLSNFSLNVWVIPTVKRLVLFEKRYNENFEVPEMVAGYKRSGERN